jgi:2,3-bisphosphoglycerate-independent phosphoglycerate mutase
VIDGWGIPSEDSPKDGDAIAAAATPVMDAFSQSPTGYTELEASSLAVGLPEGLMGNSEVGHLNIGAGRVVWQDVVRIDLAVKKNEFASNEVIQKVMQAAASGNGRLHLCGLVSHGGVVSISSLIRKGVSCRPTLLIPLTALQARPSVCSPQGREAVRCPQGLHPLLRRWS